MTVIEWLHRLFCVCDHKWETEKEIAVFQTEDGMLRLEDGAQRVPHHYEYILRCTKCGDIKKVKM